MNIALRKWLPGGGSRWRTYLFFSMLVALAGLTVAASGSFLWAEVQFRSAERALANHQYLDARTHLEKYLKIWPQSATAHLLYARVARRAGYFEDAEQQLEICRRIVGPVDSVNLERSLLLAQQGCLSPEVESQLQGYVVERHPDTTAILQALSHGYVKTFRLENARKCLGDWLEADPKSVEALLLRGWVNRVQELLAEAKDDYEHATKIDPDDYQAQLRLGQAFLLLAQPQDALPIFEKLWQLNGEGAQAGLGLARCRYQMGQVDQAESVLKQVAAGKQGQTGPVLLERGRIALQTGMVAEAEDWLRRASKLEPGDYETQFTLLHCLQRLGKVKEAEGLQNRLEQLQADIKRAKEAVNEIQKRPDNLSLRCDIGECFFRQGENEAGETWLKSALQMDPNYMPAHRALAEYYQKRGQNALAAEHRRQQMN